jgi:glycerate kinase
VIAPDSFKGTVTAVQVARALAAGWSACRPDDEVRALPMADGGEGTLDAFAAAYPDARRVPVTVTGPDDRAVETHWLRLVARDGAVTGVVELAATSGITLLDEPRPLTAHTRGFGQAIRDALDGGVDRLVLAIGGSASTDGGAGLLAELGARLLDRSGRQVPEGAIGLTRLAAVDLAELRPLPPGGATVLTDVTATLLGPSGAVDGFGAQKGLTEAWAPRVERALAGYAAAFGPTLAARATRPGAGAAGGAGFGLFAWGATPQAGARAVGDMLGIGAAVAGADWVVTGEGRYDEQSENGKVPGTVRRLARAGGARCALATGALAAAPARFDAAVSLTELAGSPRRAMTDAVRLLERAGAYLAALS